MTETIRRLRLALIHARSGIALMAAIYIVSVTIGMTMAHMGSTFALGYRDRLVSRAHQADPAAKADDAGAHGKAAAIDFSRNLLLAAVPETIGGLTLVVPVGLGVYRGWVGGIVSVDGRHRSRLTERSAALYYIVTLALQLSAFTLAGGGGMHLGLAFFWKQGPFWGPPWFRLPKPASIDVAWLYVLVVPLFAVGSIWEFFRGQ